MSVCLSPCLQVVVLAFPLLVASAKPEVLCCTKLYASSASCGDKMAALLARYKVQVVAIGNGTGSREAQVSGRMLCFHYLLCFLFSFPALSMVDFFPCSSHTILHLSRHVHVFTNAILCITFSMACTGNDETGLGIIASLDCLYFPGPGVSSGCGERGGGLCILGVAPGRCRISRWVGG
jgi:hypothetical protein